MVDVSRKEATLRKARARCEMELTPECARHLRECNWRVGKGPVIDTAIIAATQAVKRTHELIPFCHPLPVESCTITVEFIAEEQIAIECEVIAHARTGVEMEALTGVTVAALTVYDMCKALGHAMRIRDVRVIAKSGGSHDFGEQVSACP